MAPADRVAKLEKVDPTTVWNSEPYEFTPWLVDHLDELGEVLGIDLEFIDREAPVGEFSADIVARDLNQGRIVVIENQLTGSDHGHLGKLLTYAGGLGAGVVVWVCRELRDEHRQALDWLNSRSDEATGFFGVVLEVVRIDQSRPAVNFKLAAFPNTWSREAKQRVAKSENTSERSVAYQAFFQGLIDELRTAHSFTNARVALPQNWYSFSSGHRDIKYLASFSKNDRFHVALYIDSGDGDLNMRIFKAFEKDRQIIESRLGLMPEWEPLENRRACRIALYRDNSAIDSVNASELRGWAVANLLTLRAVFAPLMAPALRAAEKPMAESPISESGIDTAAEPIE